MTVPNPVSQYKPSSEDRAEFTKKDDLENLALIITNAKTAKGPKGVFWIVEAARQDTGEAVTFTGSKVIDDVMAHVKASSAFPVAAMLVKVKADNPQGYYWDLQDPPATNGNGQTPPSPRVAEVAAFIDRGGVTVSDVSNFCVEISGQDGTKVAQLTEDQYAKLIDHLRAIEAANPPLEEPPY